MSVRSSGAYEGFRWLGRGDVLQVKGFEIGNPLTYAGARIGRQQPKALDPSQIDRALPVVQASSAAPLPYWPSYDQLSPQQRYLYLSWLASGRQSLPADDGYLFLYYYGLERRALVDQADHGLVISEILRLKRLHATQSKHGGRGSFQNYSSGLLWYLVARHTRELRVEYLKALVRATSVWTEDALAAALAWFIDREHPLRPWMAYVVAEQSPNSQRSVVVQRVGDEFRRLFAKRYEAEFGRGTVLKRAKRSRAYTYRPASAVLRPVTIDITNALGLPSQFRRLSEIWNECVGELRKLSSVLRDGRPEELTSEAWEALPAELRAGVEHPFASPLFDLLVSHTDDVGNTFISAGKIAALLGCAQRSRLTIGQSRDVVTTAQHAGFALEPDARLTGRAYGWDELLVAFPQAYEGEADYRRYGGAACMLRLGIEIAEADGHVQEEELARVMGQIQTGFQLNDHERRRLEALRTLLLKIGVDVAGLGKRLQATMTAEGRQALGRLLVAVAGIDGIVTKGELAALRRCYRALGLAPALLESTLAKLAPVADEAPVSVMPGRPAVPGERIPPPPEEGMRLDRLRIMQIMEETRSVSVMLAKAMNVELVELDEEQSEVAAPGTIARVDATATVDDAPAPPPASPAEPTPSGVPARYASFIEALVSSSRWLRTDADALAREHDEMLSGAIEAINDWAIERVGTPLLYEDGDCLVIEDGLLKELGVG